MPKHIQRQATWQRGDLAGSVRTGRIFARAASRKPCGAQDTTAPSAPIPGANSIPPKASPIPGRALRIAAIGLAISLLGPTGSALAGDDLPLGRIATAEEITGWDIDIRPDGQGLPVGRGTADQGEEVYVERCALCHGEFGEGVGRYPVLIGGEDSLQTDDPVKTVTSYWPYATTLFDYIYRAMPFGDAQSLTPDEVYGITAFLLSENDLIERDQELNQANLAAVALPNRDGFIEDSRPDTPTGPPCMQDCKDSVEILYKAKILDVTPEEEETTN